MRPLPSIPDAKNINPQWSGGDLYFIADPNGVSNVFRAVIATGEVRQITRVETGVSGVTSLSPALSLAQGRVAFSEYRNGVYEIRSTPTCTCEDDPVVVTETRPALGAWLTDDAPDDAPAAKSRPYDRTLSLAGIGQPYLSAGGGSYGTFFRAGISFSVSDLLEERQINTALQVGVGGSRRDFAVQSVYLNRQSRWNWGVAGTQIPVLLGVARAPALDGESFGAHGDTGSRSPQSDASPARRPHECIHSAGRQRIEFSGGFHSITSERQVATRVYARPSGALITETQEPAVGEAAATLFEASAAMVYDTSLVGATGPVLGTRYRFEAAPTLGDLSYTTLLADYQAVCDAGGADHGGGALSTRRPLWHRRRRSASAPVDLDDPGSRARLRCAGRADDATADGRERGGAYPADGPCRSAVARQCVCRWTRSCSETPPSSGMAGRRISARQGSCAAPGPACASTPPDSFSK